MIKDVLVYRLREQTELTERDTALEHLLAAPGPGSPIEPWFEPLPNGCFRWQDLGRLGQAGARGALPPSAEAALSAAGSYMRAANAAADRYRAARGTGRDRLPNPFPVEALRPAGVHRVRSSGARRDDHWLTTWTAALPCTSGSEGGRALVLGATVEVRIGRGSHVISVVSRVRPWGAVARRPALRFPPGDADHSHDEDAHARSDGVVAEPALVYFLDNPPEPQRFLAPCWLVVPADTESHHSRRFWPASDHTVLPEMVFEDQEGRGRVFAQVLTEGGGVAAVEHGDAWRLHWSVATLLQFVAGERQASDDTSAVLPGPGIYQVELEVEHVATGSVRTTHSQIAVAAPRLGASDRRPFLQS